MKAEDISVDHMMFLRCFSYLQECGSVFRKVEEDGRLRGLRRAAWLIRVRHRVSDTCRFQMIIPERDKTAVKT